MKYQKDFTNYCRIEAIEKNDLPVGLNLLNTVYYFTKGGEIYEVKVWANKRSL
ncbi:hypothetical protein [Clostridium thermarum]|uniref:hypothetical protein n=1 Tax=Clostridium thermarum TaxID=1716543 RepID=UPI0015D66899|nr:hypothetical protein [Clostridium thermarum]